jgi:ATP/maltotriose-dependent transcriptional regulator MalT
LQAELCTLSTINELSGARQRLATACKNLRGRTPAERVLLGLEAIDLANTAGLDAAGTARRVSAALGNGFLLGTVGPDSPTYLLLLGALPWLEEVEHGESELAAAIVETRRRGAWFGFAIASSMLAYQSWTRGQLTRAEADARAAIEVANQMGWLAVFPYPVLCLGEVLTETGDVSEAERLLADNQLTGPLPQTHIHADLLGVRGRLRLSQGRIQEGIDDLDEQAARLEEVGDTPPFVRALHAKSLVPALVRNGQAERGAKIAAEALQLAHSFGRPRYIAAGVYAQALAHPGGADLDGLKDAASIYEQLEAPLDLARVLLEIGNTLRRRRQRKAARDPLRQALDLARSCGARPLAERAEHELRATGAKPRRDRITGRDALTATELRVAQLAINGMNNRQIAEALFVTRKTVESHLEHIFRKLDIHARTELKQALATDQSQHVT